MKRKVRVVVKVDRRIGGLEILKMTGNGAMLVDRRIGGLEKPFYLAYL